MKEELVVFFFSSRRRHTRYWRDWSSDVCSSDLWRWISAFFGMSTIFAEATLAQVFKTKKDGEVTGGPAYYISQGLHNKFLSGFFSISIIIALGFIGNMVQDRKSTRLNSSHANISYAVFCLKKKN